MIPRADERPNTIALQWNGKYEEGRADAAILPGSALEVTITEQNPIQLPVSVKHNATAGADRPLAIALECLLGNPDETKIQGMKIDQAYAAGDLVPYFLPAPGDIFQARVAQAANFAIGDLLKVHSDGTFVAQGGTGAVKAQVMEDHDFTADDPIITPLLRVQAV